MAYFLDLFTPETWHNFQQTTQASVTGFRERQRHMAEDRVSKGDIFLCYLTRLSRWCGILKVQSEVYYDDSPIFDDPDPFTARFKVEPIVLLKPEDAIPIYEDVVWNKLSVTKQFQRGTRGWTGFFRNSLNELNEDDGNYLIDLLKEQQAVPKIYTLTEKDNRQLAGKTKVRTLTGEVEVEIPDEDEDETSALAVAVPTIEPDSRESIRMQAKVAQIGAEMGFRIWVPRSDKARVLEYVPPGLHKTFLEALPLNYDDTTLRTVEQIDVLWLNGRSMARAFEVEHTTVIYSGLLRMADLLALQPNMDIRLHIVAPEDKRERVLREIRRPVFSLLDRGPLYKQCSFLSYESIHALGRTQHLAYMSDKIIAEYEESAEV